MSRRASDLEPSAVARTRVHTNVVVLTDWQLDALAERVAARLSDRQVAASRLVDARTLAGALGASRTFVYQHAGELGAVRLGDGPRARLRFDLDAARAAFACSAGKRSQAENGSDDGQSEQARRPQRRRLPNGLPQPGSVLAIRPRKAA